MEIKGDIYKVIGSRIQQARNDAEYTQVALAQILGKSESSIQSWENGSRRISVEELLKIAVVTDKPMSYLLGEDSDSWQIEKGRFSNKVIDHVRRCIDEMGDLYRMYVRPTTDENGNRSITYLYRLFPRIVARNMDWEVGIPFDRLLGGVESHDDLVDLIYAHIFTTEGEVS